MNTDDANCGDDGGGDANAIDDGVAPGMDSVENDGY